MAFFEVFIPAGGATAVNVTLKIEAPSWIAALKSGLAKIGEQGNVVKNIMVDIKEDKSIHVSHPKSGRVFKIHEISAAEAADDAPKAAPAPKPAAPAPAPAPAPKPAAAPAPAPKPQAAPAPAPAPAPKPQAKPAPAPAPKAAPAPAAQAKKAEHDQGRVTGETETKEKPTEKIGRSEAYVEFNAEEVLAEVFERVMDLYMMSRDEAIDFVIDLALDKVNAEAGSIVIADINVGDMYFAAARGPVADKVEGLRMEHGMGIVGFSVQEGVGLAVSEVNKDPRFFKEISDKTGFETRSLLCAPLETQGRCFGALELVNKQGTDRFVQEELNVMIFLGAKLGEYLLSIE